MSKQDWLEYFEAVNGRSATEEEIAQALAAGEFVKAEQVSADQASSEASPASSSFEQPQIPLLDSLSLLVRKLIRTTSSKDSSIHKYLNKDHRLITVSNLLNPASFLKQ